MPERRISPSRLRDQLLAARQDVAMLMAENMQRHLDTQSRLQSVIGLTDDLWRASQDDAVPEFEISARVRTVAG